MIFRAFFATMSKQGGPNWTNVRWAHSVSVLMLRRHLPAILMVHSGKSPPPPPIRASWNQNQIISLLPSCHWTAYDTVIKVGPPLTKEWHYNLKWAVETGECFGAGSAKLQLLDSQPSERFAEPFTWGGGGSSIGWVSFKLMYLLPTFLHKIN